MFLKKICHFSVFMLGALCVALTGGCVSTTASSNLSLTVDDKDRSLLLVGMITDADKVGAPAVILNFSPVNFSERQRTVSIVNYVYFKDLKEKNRKFLSVEIKPGRYFISGFNFGIPGQGPITSICSEMTLVFDIAPGKVNYIGDITLLFNTRKNTFQKALYGSDTKLFAPEGFHGFSWEFDEAGARLELANYTKISAPLTQVKPVRAEAELRSAKVGSGSEEGKFCRLRE